MRPCPACGEGNPDRARFCSSCATALDPASVGREVRKTVTIVFSDLSGSTALGERLDPETLRDIITRYFDEMSAVLVRHGGTVEKFIGDAIMAVFGVPQVNEDDPIRAVRAASEMRERLVTLNAELERDWTVTLAMRTGVNTGEVVAGDPATGQRLVTGDAVNVAARLEQAATAGQILLGEGTFQLVRDAVEAEAVAPLALKGKAQTVKAHRLVRVIPGATGRARRLDSPMVGRGVEQAGLEEAFTRAVVDRSVRLITVLGPAGVGKSRLVAEFVRAVADSSTVLQGRCLHYGEGITYWPVLEAVRSAAGITDADASADMLAKIAVLLEGETDGPVIAVRLAQLLGIGEGAAVREETFWAIRRLFDALARRGTVVLHFDDLQWGEPTFLDLIEHLAQRSGAAPMLLLCVARPELLEHRPNWGRDELRATTLRVEPLDEVQSQQLIANLLGSAQLDPVARQRIARVAEGNPLFVEEMLSMLIDDGLLRNENGSWVPTGDLSTVAVPESIHALLAARLDRLAPGERIVIESGSIEGQVFHRGAVRELSAGGTMLDVAPSLAALTRKELIGPDEPSFAGEDAFRFRHILIRDAAYEGLQKKTRAALHERFAVWLERVAADRALEFEEIIAYHLERSCVLRRELGAGRGATADIAERAAGHLEASGRRAYERGDLPAVVNLLSRAAALTEAHDPTRLALLPDLARALNATARFDAADVVLADAVAGAQASGDRGLEERATVLRLLINMQRDPTSDLPQILERIQRAIDVSSERADDKALGVAWNAFGVLTYSLGRSLEGEAALRRAIAHARRANDHATESNSVGVLAITVRKGPTPVAQALQACAEIRAGLNPGRLADAFVLEQESILWAMHGDLDRAFDSNTAASATYRDLGVTWFVAGATMVTGQIYLLADDPGSAERTLAEGEESLRALGETATLSTVAALRAEALYRLERYDAALDATRSSEAAAAPDDVDSQARWRAVRGKCLARLGDPRPGEVLCREAVTMIKKTDWLSSQADTVASLGEVLRLDGRESEAAVAFQESLELYERKGNRTYARKIRELLEQPRS